MNGKKVITGTQDGVIGIFSYGMFGDVTDRFPGHPQSIETICKLTEEIVVTGSSDGLLRIIQLFPNKLLGVAGEHGEFPVENVILSWDQNYLASCSHDHTVRFWDISYMFGEYDDDHDDEGEEEKGNVEEQGKVNNTSDEDFDKIISEFKEQDARIQEQQQPTASADDDDGGEGGNGNWEDSNSEAEKGPSKKKKRKGQLERNRVKNAKKKQVKNSFFADL